MAKVLLGVKIEPEMKQKLEYIADRMSMGYPDTVRVALSSYIQKFEKENGKIKL